MANPLVWIAVLVGGGVIVALCLIGFRMGLIPGSSGAASDAGPGSGDSDGPMISLVALLAEPSYLDATVLARAASRAWNTEIGTGEEDDEATSFVVGESPHFIVKWEEWVFAVHNLDAPYFDLPNEEALDEIPDLRQRQIVASNQAWLSVDLLSGPEQSDQHAAYRHIGPLLAELIDELCLALYSPEAERLFPYEEATADHLVSAHPLQALQEVPYVPVVRVADDDPRMQAAVEEARGRWQEFVSAFEQRTDEQDFSIKAPISDGENTEFIWVSVTAIEGESIYGKIANDPVALRGMALDSRVQVPVAELNDWVYTDGDEMHGGFTIKVLGE
jgi:uncharacterized protein YegJ (DUF2314 family)